MSEKPKPKEPFLNVAERCLPINEILSDLNNLYQAKPEPKQAIDIIIYFKRQLAEISYYFSNNDYKPDDIKYINIPDHEFLKMKTFEDFCNFLQTHYRIYLNNGLSFFDLYNALN